jgi:hypothetical protein
MIRLLTITMIFVSLSNASQYDIISKKDLDNALNAIANSDSLYYFCAPCLDIKPKLIQVKSIKGIVDEYSNDYYSLLINNVIYDLAYIYFYSDKNKWKNLAFNSELITEEVPHYIYTDFKDIVYENSSNQKIVITDMDSTTFSFKHIGICELHGEAIFKSVNKAFYDVIPDCNMEFIFENGKILVSGYCSDKVCAPCIWENPGDCEYDIQFKSQNDEYLKQK